jgi:hypothetical protein
MSLLTHPVFGSGAVLVLSSWSWDALTILALFRFEAFDLSATMTIAVEVESPFDQLGGSISPNKGLFGPSLFFFPFNTISQTRNEAFLKRVKPKGVFKKM